MISPLCTVNSASTLNGVNVTASTPYTIALADHAGVKQWSLRCLNTDELLTASAITAGLSINNTTKVATATAPVAGSALIFESKVNGGKDANNVADPSLTCTFGVYVLTSSGYRVGAFDEKAEGSAAAGWLAKFNALVRSAVLSGDGDVLVNGASFSLNVESGECSMAADDTGAFDLGAAQYIALNVAPNSLALHTDGLIINAPIGFYNTTPIAKPAVSGSRGGNAALASLLTALASYGLIVNSTT